MHTALYSYCAIYHFASLNVSLAENDPTMQAKPRAWISSPRRSSGYHLYPTVTLARLSKTIITVHIRLSELQTDVSDNQVFECGVTYWANRPRDLRNLPPRQI